jgi:hypothetical protein
MFQELNEKFLNFISNKPNDKDKDLIDLQTF